MNKNLTLIGLVIVAIIVLPVVIWGFISFTERGTAPVAITVVPSDSLVKIDSQEYKGKKSIRLKPGTYDVSVSKQGFATDTQKLIVKENEEANLISLLVPTSDDAQYWVKKNQSAYLEAEKKASLLATKQGEDFTDRHPITKWLPLQKATYLIGYRQVEGSDDIIITISATEGFREAALQEIRDRNFDPSDYVIEFNDYRNPFNE